MGLGALAACYRDSHGSLSPALAEVCREIFLLFYKKVLEQSTVVASTVRFLGYLATPFQQYILCSGEIDGNIVMSIHKGLNINLKNLSSTTASNSAEIRTGYLLNTNPEC